ncbi:hypothetical protein [Eremococcus coleocola]|uniref:HTH cro/C1-type domain-containing protein n=1 Tax=Eremococcus coleocola ACS-139-V-Col8 TaxID=908337 RepID=E4KQ90_9LACT|nr:hypothetical protein [Eremococcus coleocola]EFR30897.1 hypothetical protein HMPREF9257_1690 [Eremococcus coleocola ACS-139-V-Col8]
MDEIIEMIQRLIDSDISAYQITKDTGISGNAINSIRRGERKLTNLTLETAKVLYDYAKDIFA